MLLDDSDKLLLLCVVFKAFLNLISMTKENRRTIWTREIFLKEERELHGFFRKTFSVIKERDQTEFYKAVRMGVPQFNLLLSLIKDKITKSSRREPINPECRLALTCVHLAHAAPRQILSWAFKMGVSTVGNIILETCEALWEELAGIYLSSPNEDEWRRIADDFSSMAGMPHCVGAIDGKHVNIKCPPNAGSEFYNYKGHHSIILLAACDTNLCFTAVDIGAFGSQSDGGVFSQSVFGNHVLNETLPLPKPKFLPNSNVVFPYYFVADSAFPLRRNLMRPYPGRNLPTDKEHFNTRLSKARRLIENAFGVLASRWRILLTTINCHPENVDKIIKAVVLLHNFCKMNDNSYCPINYADHWESNGIVEGLWRQEIQQLRSFRYSVGLNASRNAFALRDVLKDYLANTEEV